MSDRLERAVAALDPSVRAEMLRVITLPQPERAAEIGRRHSDPRTRNWAELLMDLEEDEFSRAAMIDLLRFAPHR